MKTIYYFLTCILLLFASVQGSFAQINLQCNGNDLHSIYLVGSSDIYRIDSIDTNPSSPIWVASHSMGIGGLAISSLTGQETLHFISSTVGNTYHYWDGTAWINSGHLATGAGAINLGGSADYVFNLSGTTNSLYRYDGTGNDVLLVSNLGTSSGAVFDVATDNQGNFYLLYTVSQKIKVFNPAGIPVDSFTTSGFPTTGSGPGFAIIGNRMYAISGTSIYEGIKSGNNFNFTAIVPLTVSAFDIAACPQAGNPLAVFENPGMPHFAVYPNPASESFQVSGFGFQVERIEIFNLLGKLISSQKPETSNFNIQTSTFPNGIYIIKAYTEKGVFQQNLVSH